MTTKINSYTGLPDDLHETYADIKILEHPVSVRNAHPENYQNDREWARQIELNTDNGWELVMITQTTTIAKVFCDATHTTVQKLVTVPVYVLGRRRDPVLEELRQEASDARNDLYNARRKAEKAEALEKEVERLRAKVDELEKSRSHRPLDL